MAVIVLNGADFSQNNIGQIDLVIPFLKTTKEILARYGITVNEENPFQMAFNTFVNDLTKNGVYPKIKNLCLPFMANVAKGGDLAYAQINALDGENFFTDNISGSLAMVGNGLKAVDGGALAIANLLDYANTKNLHYGAYNITPESKTLSTTMKVIYGGTGKSIWLAKNTSYARPELWVVNPCRIGGDENYIAASCLILGNISAARSTLVVNGQIADYSPTSFDTGADANPRVLQYSGTNYSFAEDAEHFYTASNASWSLFTIGDPLTDEESIAYNNAVNKLMQAVNEYL